MDKYTVDLDQVLNDFEYSELTDQHSFNQTKSNNKQNSNTYVHNNFKNTNVKHSINNVFHSLNEYLNTDISPKCEIQPILPEPSFSGENSKQEIEDNNVTDEVTETSQNHVISDEEIEESHIICEETTPSDNQARSEETSQSDIVQNETIESDIIQNKTIESDIIQSKTIEPDIIQSETIESDIIQNETIESDIQTETIEDNIKSDDPFVVETESIEEKTDLVEDATTTSDLETVTQPEEEEENVIKVGFDDEIDLDDSELNRYLDELEKEYEETPKTEEPETPKVEETEEESSVRPNNLPLPNQEEEKSVIDLVGRYTLSK